MYIGLSLDQIRDWVHGEILKIWVLFVHDVFCIGSRNFHVKFLLLRSGPWFNFGMGEDCKTLDPVFLPSGRMNQTSNLVFCDWIEWLQWWGGEVCKPFFIKITYLLNSCFQCRRQWHLATSPGLVSDWFCGESDQMASGENIFRYSEYLKYRGFKMKSLFGARLYEWLSMKAIAPLLRQIQIRLIHHKQQKLHIFKKHFPHCWKRRNSCHFNRPTTTSQLQTSGHAAQQLPLPTPSTSWSAEHNYKTSYHPSNTPNYSQSAAESTAIRWLDGSIRWPSSKALAGNIDPPRSAMYCGASNSSAARHRHRHRHRLPPTCRQIRKSSTGCQCSPEILFTVSGFSWDTAAQKQTNLNHSKQQTTSNTANSSRLQPNTKANERKPYHENDAWCLPALTKCARCALPPASATLEWRMIAARFAWMLPSRACCAQTLPGGRATPSGRRSIRPTNDEVTHTTHEIKLSTANYKLLCQANNPVCCERFELCLEALHARHSSKRKVLTKTSIRKATQ